MQTASYDRPSRSRKWRVVVLATAFGLLLVGSVVDGQVGPRLPESSQPASRSSAQDDAFRNTANSAATRPPLPGSDELRRLQAELDALGRAQAALIDDPPSAGSDSLSERAKLKERLIELIEKLKSSGRPASAGPPSSSRPTEPATDAKPVDRLKQAENLYRAGEIRLAQRVLQSIDAAGLSSKQAGLVRYLRASCHRRLGEYDQARQLYREIAASKDDTFLADCATWQLQAIRTREEIAAQTGSTRTPSTPK
jgi:tetratricopeptide (TPR) repeat protein